MRRLSLFFMSLLSAVLLAACSGGSAGDGAGGGAGSGTGPGTSPGTGGAEAPAAVLYRVGGRLSGLGAGKTVVLGDASGPRVSLGANGEYSVQLAAGTAYDLQVLAQPAGQTCQVANGTGTVQADIDHIDVNCYDDVAGGQGSPHVGGVLTGLDSGKTVLLQLQAATATQELGLLVDGRFAFAQPVTGAYSVTVRTQPAGQVCTVTNGQGTAGPGISVADVAVRCAGSAFKLAGVLSGNSGTVVLRNATTGESVTLVSNGGFSFVQPVPAGGAYAVTVAAATAASVGDTQSCSVANGVGTATADVQMTVTCATQPGPVAPPPVVSVPAVPSALALAYDVKAFKLAWAAVAPPAGGGAVTYRVFEDADGPGPGTAIQVATGLSQTEHRLSVPGLLHERLNARYTVQACNAVGCSASGTPVAVNVTKAIGYFKASNTDANDLFGSSIALSGDGTTLAIGAFAEDSNATGINGNQADNSATSAGAVYVFTRTAGMWAQQAYLKPSNTRVNHRFGITVALSADGNTLAVGATGDSSGATGVNGDQSGNTAASAGAVYVFSRAASVWAQQAYVKASNTQAGDAFGVSVALSASGDVMAVGASGEDSGATGINGDQLDNSVSGSGAVYVFNRLAGSWSQQAYIKASTVDTSDVFGYPLALSGDGHTLAVGSQLERSGASGINGDQTDNSLDAAGAVWVFASTGGSWSQQAYVKASNTDAYDVFGVSMALSTDGNTLAVGAHGEGSNATGINGIQSDNSAATAGAVYVFSRTGAVWVQQAYVKASNTQAYVGFGYSVALTGDGNTLAVGAPEETSASAGIDGDQSSSALNRGAVYLFTRSAGAWSQKAYVKASSPAGGSSFGEVIALSADGKTMAVAAPREGSNAAGINPGGINGDAANVAAPAAGAVYLY